MKAEINGITMQYEIHGAGPSVLFIHGFPLSGKLWEPLIEPLQDDYRLIIPDLRGHGKSEATERASMAEYADDLVALLDEVGEARPVVVVGLSMGGYIAFEFYRRYPERVHALVLANTRAQADTEEAKKGRYESAEKALSEGSAGIAESMAGKLFASGTPDDLRSTWQEIMAATPPQGIAAALRAMAERSDSTELLETLNRPVLIIAGEEDRIVPVEEAEMMHEAIAGSDLETVMGAGHLTPVEQPTRFTALLLQFLDDLDPVDRQGWPYRPDVPGR